MGTFLVPRCLDSWELGFDCWDKEEKSHMGLNKEVTHFTENKHWLAMGTSAHLFLFNERSSMKIFMGAE